MTTLRFVLFTLLALALTVLRGAVSWAAELPNVLFIVSDDHAAYVSGAYGNPQARTPNLDRFARTGVVFTQAFCNSPLCTASRQSLLTGKLPHSIGVTLLRTPLSPETTTLADVLAQAGYDTAAYGKMHFNSGLNHGFDEHLDRRDHAGFLEANPPRPIPEGLDVLPRWRPFRDPASIWLNGMYAPYGAYEADMAGTWFARQARHFLERQPEDDPFFLMVSFYEPHSPFHFPIEYANSFDPDAFEAPEVRPEDNDQIPEIFRNLTEEQKRNIIAAYYTSTEYMDRNVGRVLDALDESGHADDTLVIYLGDHGYSLGHHGRFEKHTMFEESVHSPLIIRTPDMNQLGQRTDALVEFIDLFPTVMDYCGLEGPDDLEGISLMPCLEQPNDPAVGRDYVFSEYYEHEEAMIRTHEYKYIYQRGEHLREDGYQTGLPMTGPSKQLYSLRTDPRETTNLAHDESYQELIARMEEVMLERFHQTHPKADEMTEGLTRDEQLSFFLRYRPEPTSLEGAR